jgi:phage terminase small subunit
MVSWWLEIVVEHDLKSHHLRLLRLGCEAWDRAQQARKLLDAEGITFTDKNGDPRSRPEVAIERDSRTAFGRIVKELNLNAPGPKQYNSIGWPIP